MLRWNKNRKGFTLVELVIVIAILGILALYALPKYQGMIEQARSSEAQAQLGSFRSALGIYYAKNHGKYPSLSDVQSGSIFANNEVPEVEITDPSGNIVRNSTVADGGTTVPIPSSKISSDPKNDGCWIYAVTSDNTSSDVRLNSTGTDSVTGKYWYQY